ncbi:MAG TPA: hypothetical protein VIG48_07780 [Jatrophihabitans sp.]
MRFRAFLLALVLTLAGCSSSGGGTAATSGSSSARSATALAATLKKATVGLTSAHIALDAGPLGGAATGDVRFADGHTTASDVTVDLAGKTRIVTVGDTSWAMLPSGRNTSGKPWVLVSSSTSNEFARALVSQVGVIKAAVSVPEIADVVAHASSVRDLGTSAQGHHYALLLAMNRIKDTALGGELATLGTDPLPVDVYLDPQGRPVKIDLAAKVGGQSLPIAVTVSNFGAPVHISAPPADQVAS